MKISVIKRERVPPLDCDSSTATPMTEHPESNTGLGQRFRPLDALRAFQNSVRKQHPQRQRQQHVEERREVIAIDEGTGGHAPPVAE